MVLWMRLCMHCSGLLPLQWHVLLSWQQFALLQQSLSKAWALTCPPHPDALLSIARMRLQDMSVCKGVRIEDMGHKQGCNGVDNGKLWFDRTCPAQATCLFFTKPCLPFAALHGCLRHGHACPQGTTTCLHATCFTETRWHA